MEPVDMRPSKAFWVPAAIVTVGLYLVWFARTSYRLESDRLRVELGVLRRVEEDVPLTKVTSVTARLSPLPGGSAVVVGTGGGERTVVMPHLSRRDARVLADAVKQAREQAT